MENIKEWTGLGMAETQRTEKDREGLRKVIKKLSMPQGTFQVPMG